MFLSVAKRHISCSSHNGPVWQVAWAHPKYGHILASCSYDGKVLIWKEQSQGQAQGGGFGGWAKIKEHSLHSASGAQVNLVLYGFPSLTSFSVNSVSWAPHELGAIVACASSDGKLSVLTFKSTCRLTSPPSIFLPYHSHRRRYMGSGHF